MLAGEKFQRVQLAVGGVASSGERLFGGVLADETLGDQVAQQVIEIQPAILSGELNGHPDSLEKRSCTCGVEGCVSDHGLPRIVPVGTDRSAAAQTSIAGFYRRVSARRLHGLRPG
ncbi:hypothetical protein D3C84_810100 [compost metagenome]